MRRIAIRSEDSGRTIVRMPSTLQAQLAVPKAVCCRSALTNLINWNVGTLARGKTFLQFASLSFDASVHEMFAAWSSGRALVMIPESWRRDPEKLLRHLARSPVDTVILPVVVLQQWAEQYETTSHVGTHFADIIATGEQLQITQPIRKLFPT